MRQDADLLILTQALLKASLDICEYAWNYLHLKMCNFAYIDEPV